MTTAMQNRWVRPTTAAVAAAVVVILTMALAPPAGAGQPAPPASKITVEQTDRTSDKPCFDYVPDLDPFTPLPPQITWTKQDTDEAFVITVDLSAPLCAQLEVHAVIYNMPSGEDKWPQQLGEKVTFTLAGAGTTVITFDKDCTPVQFDVLVGATPPLIVPPAVDPANPLGILHGPLLLGTIDSSVQYSGNGPGCTSTTTTTTTTSSTTTTTLPVVQGSTTVPRSQNAVALGGTSAATSGAPDAVAGTSATRPAALALGGQSSHSRAALGACLLGLGLALSLLSRRSRTRSHA